MVLFLTVDVTMNGLLVYGFVFSIGGRIHSPFQKMSPLSFDHTLFFQQFGFVP
jgi:hypothetical protein